MPRGVKREVIYTGKTAKIYDRVQKLESELKNAKEELKIAYKEQIRAEKEAEKKAKQENQAKILKIIKESGKTPEEIIALLNASNEKTENEE